MRVSKRHDGKVLVSELSGQLNGDALTGSAILTYVSEERVWKQSWADSMGNFLLSDGKLHDNEMSFTWTMDISGKDYDILHVYRDMSASRFVTELYTSPPGEDTWQLVRHSVYTRR